MNPKLSARSVTAHFGDFQVLWGVDLDVSSGEIVAILGPNGSGKSTFMGTLSGVHPKRGGTVLIDGVDVSRQPSHARVALGMSHVLERRRLFPHMSVHENLLLGAYSSPRKAATQARLDRVFQLFPLLPKRLRQQAHTLSGGEQQMVAIGRGLMSDPQLLLLDEPLLGLSPMQVDVIATAITALKADGVTVIFIEQNVELALAVADRCLLLRDGGVVLNEPTAAIGDPDVVMAIYMGGDPVAVLGSREHI